ncbi:cytochrome c oxidase subunit 3 [Ancylobacter defluvii]|uniref:Cytochrome-c oxidase n=1 Tax=Ancylobacter defluvii TaxID=1282440 RepID=A0A9W6NA08_9HYPH|nr:cytochrome c oxidase subunit 3 [Ancylobacter defluvii]MBS7589942.1 cytochrome c oxidase subunit 3 [Ancylobacter defluvii]GLK83067.1 cytochrome-c oxidase [Ancylobacter defluvii]
MIIVVAFLAIVIVIAAWWLSTQRIMSKPWLEIGFIDELPGVRPPPTKIGLGIFLAVAGVLFALSISAYSMRLQSADWWPLPAPRLLWFNTGLLILAGAALEWTKRQSRHADLDGVRFGLIAAGVFTLAFVIGQLVVWRELVGEGYFLAANPANAFFYLMTGLHMLHVLGGLVALARVTFRAFGSYEGRGERDRLRLGLELCAIYWHFLLVVWLVLFALIAGWAGEFFEICRQALS